MRNDKGAEHLADVRATNTKKVLETTLASNNTLVQPDNRTHLECALEYAQKGWHVFPVHYVLKDGACSCGKDCGRLGKHPANPHGSLKATTNTEQIKCWWAERPKYNIGLATGDAGLQVIDIDVNDGKVGAQSLAKLIDLNGPLPKTLTQQTGSRGTHYFFHSDKLYKNSTNKIGQHIDSRGKGGYVILPPSNHYSGGRYSWINSEPIAELPDWLGANLVEEGEKPPAGKRGKKGKQRIDASEDASAPLPGYNKMSQEEIREMIVAIPSDDRGTWMTVGVGLKHELPEEVAHEIWDKWAETSDNYDQIENAKQWNTYRTDFPVGQQITIASVIKLALEHDWKPKPKWASLDGTTDLTKVETEWVYCEDLKRFIRPVTGQHWDKEQIGRAHV